MLSKYIHIFSNIIIVMQLNSVNIRSKGNSEIFVLTIILNTREDNKIFKNTYIIRLINIFNVLGKYIHIFINIIIVMQSNSVNVLK